MQIFFTIFFSYTLTCIARISPNTVFWQAKKRVRRGMPVYKISKFQRASRKLQGQDSQSKTVKVSSDQSTSKLMWLYGFKYDLCKIIQVQYIQFSKCRYHILITFPFYLKKINLYADILTQKVELQIFSLISLMYTIEVSGFLGIVYCSLIYSSIKRVKCRTYLPISKF